jgi:hypothetical protein
MRRDMAWVGVVLLAACVGRAESPCGGPGTICLLAGDGELGFSGDGREATSSQLYWPTAVRVGHDGLVYVMDFNNMRLRRIEADGTLRTVVGNGEHLGAVAGAKPLDTPLENPIDFAFQTDGAIVIVSQHDPRLLRVREGKGVEVVAGTGDQGDSGDDGPATAATFVELTGVALAKDGTIYVSDGEGHRVRAVTPDGRVTTVAGVGVPGYTGDGGSARGALLTRPAGLALDAAGDLYVADSGANVIRRVRIKSGIIESVAGTGKAGASGDGGLATRATLRSPQGVAVADDGVVYIADSGNSRIRSIDRKGRIETIAGTGAAGYAGDGGPAVHAELDGPSRLELANGKLYVPDTGNARVRVIELGR